MNAIDMLTNVRDNTDVAYFDGYEGYTPMTVEYMQDYLKNVLNTLGA